MQIQASHFFDFLFFPESCWEHIFAEFEACGVSWLSLNSSLCTRMISDPELPLVIRDFGERYHIGFAEAHAPFGYGMWDLNVSDSRRRPMMIELHKLCMQVLGSLGVKRYTMHIGALECYTGEWQKNRQKYRSLAMDTLDRLLPTAEQEGMVIAIENAYEPANTPGELLIYLEKFDTPALGCCFDSGHAAILEGDSTCRHPGEIAGDIRNRAWGGSVEIQHDSIRRLSPWIVTAHLHDNDGKADQHRLVFEGSIDWRKYMSELRRCPRLEMVQNEANMMNPVISVAAACRAFDRLLEF